MIVQRYEVGEKIGEGGMGTVHRAIDRHSGQTVAIKRLRTESANSALIARFLREADALRQLNHPNIVKLFDAVEEDGQNYLVMEYVSGGSLADLLRREGKLSLEKILPLALDLADALTRTHRLNILHRDVKPANVLIAEDGTPRLTDFGLAHFSDLSPITDSGSFTGTYSYASPEACQNRDLDARTDIWSFGVMLFEMLAGRRPFEAERMLALLDAIVRKPPLDLEQLCPDAPAALVDLVYRMLVKNRAERLSSARLVGVELEALLRGVKVQLPNADATHVIKERFAISPASPPPHNLPTPTTPFVGRDAEIEVLCDLLAKPATRLLTIVAPGGMGKTRLGLQVADHFASAPEALFSNGVTWLDLTPLATPETILPALIEALGYILHPGERNPQEQLLDILRDERRLLLLDNFEHLLEGGALVSTILQAAPHVKILATSRQRLNLNSETVFQLGGLDIPEHARPDDMQYSSAVRLFVQSAQRAQTGFEAHSDDIPDIVRICELVGGMPLGIVLAASWLYALSLSDIADELAHNPDFLDTDQSDIPERQRSLRRVFEYAWNLLGEAERDVFMALSVCHGGFTREAAQAISGANLRSLLTLLNHSLLLRDVDTGRYAIHELLRQYAALKLDENPPFQAEVLHRHAEYYLRYLRAMTPVMKRERHPEVMFDMDNFRAAWNQTLHERNIPLMREAQVGLIGIYWRLYWYDEGREVFGRATTLLEAMEPTPEVRLTLGLLLISRESAYGSEEVRDAALDIFRSLEPHPDMTGAFSVAVAARLRTGAGSAQGKAKFRALAEETLQLAQRFGQAETIAHIHSLLGWYFINEGNLSEAQAYLDEAFAYGLRSGDLEMVGRSASQLGRLEIGEGNYKEAERLFQAAADARRTRDHLALLATDLASWALALFYQMKYQEAETLLQESYALAQSMNHSDDMADAGGHLAHFAYLRGEVAQAVAMFEVSKLSSELVVMYPWRSVRKNCGMATCLTALNRPAEALPYLHAALTEVPETRLKPLMLDCILVALELPILIEDIDQRLELLALIQAHPAASPHHHAQLARLLEPFSAQTQSNAFAAAIQRGQSRDLEATITDLRDLLARHLA